MIRFTLYLRTRNPLNSGTGNTRLAGILRSKERAAHRGVALLSACAALRLHRVTGREVAPIQVSLTRVSAGVMDDDGLAASMKGIRDGIADALGINDGDVANLSFRYLQRRGPRRHHEVDVLIAWEAR